MIKLWSLMIFFVYFLFGFDQSIELKSALESGLLKIYFSKIFCVDFYTNLIPDYTWIYIYFNRFFMM